MVTSQNHRIIGIRRDLCRSSSSTSLLKQVHLDQAAQDIVQAGFEYLQWRRIHNLCGQPVPGLHDAQSEEFLPHVQMELPMLQFVPVAPYPSLGTIEKSLAPSSWHPPLRYLKAFIRSPLSLLFCRLNKPSSLSLSSQERCFGPLIIFVALRWTLSSSYSSFLNWGAQKWTQYSRWVLTRAE